MDSIASSFQLFSLSNASNLADRASKFISNISTPLVSRNGIVQRVIRHNGHLFDATLLTKPTKCSYCDKMIWLPHGQRCKSCKMISHIKCVHSIEVGCAKNLEVNSETGKPGHKFELLKTVRSPTMCDHCGSYIIVLCEYSKCSSCFRNFHQECKHLLLNECRPRSSDKMISHYTNDSRMTIDQFELLGLIGSGSFSKVYLARQRSNHQDGLFAIKVIKKTNPAVNGDPEAMFNEWKCLQLGRSYPFLTIAHCCFQSRDRLFFVMEYVQGMDLLYYVNEQGAFTEDRVRFHSAEIILALMYLHKNNIVYRDLKLNNIILDRYGHCRLIDFGMSKQLISRDQLKTSTFCGTVFYLSPEILKGHLYDYSVDWWCLGVLMYEMLCDSLPFNGNSDEEIFKAILSQDLTFPVNISLSENAESILRGFLTKDPRKRLGCDLMDDFSVAIKKHAFFTYEDGIDKSWTSWWDDIAAMRIKPPFVPKGSGQVYNPNQRSLTPVETSQIDEVPQSCFDDFSQYSRSFIEGECNR